MTCKVDGMASRNIIGSIVINAGAIYGNTECISIYERLQIEAFIVY